MTRKELEALRTTHAAEATPKKEVTMAAMKKLLNALDAKSSEAIFDSLLKGFGAGTLTGAAAGEPMTVAVATGEAILPSAPTVASAAPSWAETTLQWLRENHPEFLVGRGTAQQRLVKALRKMSFEHPHHESSSIFGTKYDPSVYDTFLGMITNTWGRPQHEQMVKFLKEGGFVDARLALEDDDGVVIPGTEVDLDDLAPGRPPGLPAAPKVVKIDMTPEDELKQAVDAEKLANDERWGAW